MNRICIITTFLIFFSLSAGAWAQANVWINPSTQAINVTDVNVRIDVEITGVSNLYGFQFDLVYDNALLTNDFETEGGFLSNNGTDDVFCVSADKSQGGLIRNYACTRQVPGDVSGNGPLAQINFTINNAGTSVLGLDNIKLSDINSQPITFTQTNGSVTTLFCTNGETRSCSPPYNETGECAYGTETCTGGVWTGICVGAILDSPEICDGLNNDCDGTAPIGDIDEDWPLLGTVCTVGIGICENTGSYICNAGQDGTECDASPLSPGTEACPYTLTDEDCDGDTNEYKGDADCDGCVNIFDLTTIGTHFGETLGHPNWNATADLRSDNVIDIFDLVMIGSNFNNAYEGASC